MATAVMADTRRTKMIVAYLIGLTTVGITAILVTALAELDSIGYFVGGFFLLAGFAGLGGLKSTGGAWTAACPSCGATMSSAEFGDEWKLRDAKVVRCPRCGVYARGAESLAEVEPGYIHPSPAFEARLPQQFSWPDGCQVCAGPPTRTVPVEGRSFAGNMAGVVGGIATVVTANVPVCEAHAQEPVWLFRKAEGPVIRFRAIEMWKRFRVRNELP